MLHFLPAPLRGLIASLLLALNTLFWCWPLFFVALLKLLLPFAPIQRALRFVMHGIAESWIGINKFWMRLVGHIEWKVQGLERFDTRHSYLVTSNHQSWVDILVLQYLLKPKAGGIAFVLDAMGEQLHAIVNVTIHYPHGVPGFWELLCGRLDAVQVIFRQVDIPREFIGRNYDQDDDYRLAFQQWVNRLWEEKDAELAGLHQQA